MADMSQIGNALQGFSAGIQGTLPQFIQGQQNQRQLDTQDRRQRQVDAVERQKTMYTDAMAGLNLLKSGNLDGFLSLGAQRLQILGQLAQDDPTIDPSDTQRMMQLGIAAKNGSQEALKLLQDELGSVVEVGTAIGVLKAPEAVRGIEVEGSVVDPTTGRVIYQAPKEPEKISPQTEAAKLQVDLRNGLINQADYDAAIQQIRQPMAQRAASTDIGKLNQDLNTGAITRDQYDQEVNALIQARETQQTQAATAAATAETKAGEDQNRQQLVQAEIGRAAELAEKLLQNESGLAKATGPISARLPSVRGETVDFEADLSELQSLLTMSNLGRMTGVLSESDIKLIREAASGINATASEQRMRTKLQEIRDRLMAKMGNQPATPESASASGGQQVNGYVIREIR